MHRMLLLIALAGILAACGSAVPTNDRLGSPAASRSMAADASPSSAASPIHLDVEAMGWERIGSFDNFRPTGLVGFAGGYVAYGTSYPEGALVAWATANGTHWLKQVLVDPAGCGGSHEASFDSMSGAGSDGEVLLLGRDCHGTWRTWHTTDGLVWDGVSLESDASDGDVVATPDGWEVVLMGNRVTVIHSADGLTWGAPVELSGASGACCPKSAAGRDGTRVIGDHLGLLLTSTDGRRWDNVTRPYDVPDGGGSPADGEWLRGIVAAPTGAETTWIIYTERTDGAPASAWVSRDLISWTRATLPARSIISLADTRFGLVAIGTGSANAAGTYLSGDGLTWRGIRSSVRAAHVADGPAGVIAIGRSPEDAPGLTVWGLRHVPPSGPPPIVSQFSSTEAGLVLGLRADAQVNCIPKRHDLPAGSTAAVECTLEAAPVARVAAYAFPTEREAAATYLERLGEYGVAPQTGNCYEGTPGDSPNTPGDGEGREGDEGVIAWNGKILVAARFGCFRNEEGIANVRVTCGGGIYIGVLGTNGDIAALAGWAGRHPGGRPMSTPSPPGICLGP